MKRADLPGLTIFAVVAGQRSFRGAARSLGLSVSAVSHAITALEASLGLQLLARTTRSVAPTPAGRRLLEQLEPALASITDAVEAASASQHRISGTIRLSVPRVAASLLVLPIATRFAQAFPEVTVELMVQDGFTDIVDAGFDAGVRFGEALHQDMVAVPLGPPHRAAIVGSPAYFAGRRRPLRPEDLHEHLCIQRRFSGSGSLYRWELEREGITREVAVDGPLILNDPGLVVEAALAGVGLAMTLEREVEDHLAAGRLVRVLEDWCPSFPGFFLYYPTRRLLRPALRAFIDFARREERSVRD